MQDTIFTGTYYYQIDPKGRMRLPASFKSLLGEKLRIGFGVGKFLVVYTEQSVEELSKQRKALNPLSDMQALKHYRNMFMSMKEFTCDAQGRYKIPMDYCEEFELTDEIVIVGNDSTVEIWSKANFDRRDEDEIAFWQLYKK
ncbi:MAG: hypothetical protein IJX70_02860 [Clostridia bacterium]|nr:hypothetical protein [Clostridia bacterium]